MKRVYVAGALNAPNVVEFIKNCHIMMDYAEQIRMLGFSVFVPCLDILMGIKFGYMEYSDYYDNNVEWLKAADAMFVCPNSENSKGTQREIETAILNSIPIFYDISILLRHKF